MARKQFAHRRQPCRIGAAQIDQGRYLVATTQPDPGTVGVFDHAQLPARSREYFALVRTGTTQPDDAAFAYVRNGCHVVLLESIRGDEGSTTLADPAGKHRKPASVR